MNAKWSFDSAGIGKTIAEAITRDMTRSIVGVQSALREMLSRKGSGVGYIGGRKGQGSFRTRSAPGEPPAVDTGRLRNSVASAPIKTSATPILIRVGLTSFQSYGKYLERGTARIAPRPWVRPTLDKQRTLIIASVARAVAHATAQFESRR